MWLEQVHGARVLDLDVDAMAPADGAVTARAGVVCAVLTADCLPVLFCSAHGRRVGVAHAGWRGLAGGVLPAAVQALGAPAGDVLAWLGPAIGAAAYEVGDEVRSAYSPQIRRQPGASQRMRAADGRPIFTRWRARAWPRPA